MISTTWEALTLGDLGKWVTGSTPPSSDNANWGDDVSFVTPGDIGYGGKLGDVARRISNIGADRVRRVKPGSVILVCIGTIGKVAWTDQEITTNQQINTLEVDQSRFDIRFVHWLLASPSVQEKLWHNSTSTTVALINKKTLEKIPCSVPPLDEQRRIVETLDEHLSRLDKALAEVSHNRRRFSSLRKTYLDALYRGALTPRFGSPAIVPLSEVSTIINGDRGKNYPSKSARVSAGIPFINAGHVDNGSIDMSTMDFISPERFDLLGSGKVAKGDVLFCLRGSLGKVGIVKDFEKGAIASSLAILRANAKILPEYLLGYFQTSAAAEMIRRFDNGTAQPNLSSANLAKFEFPLFPIDIQEQIVPQVRLVNQNLKMLDAAHANLTLQVNQLRRSVLHTAFQGTFVREKTNG